jgi:hypothetical protein
VRQSSIGKTKTKAAQTKEIERLKGDDKRREARVLRARMLGLGYGSDELNSDNTDCEEFDYASDSSLVLPW